MSAARRSIAHSIMTMLLLVGMPACCANPAVIHLGAPYDRYDHNRVRPIVSQAIQKGAPTTVDDRAYAPNGSISFPKAEYESGTPAEDGLSVANVVPIFTGVPLPLSSTSIGGARSDRDDLVDFLSVGAMAQAGVKPRPMPGDTKATAARYKVLLDLLASPDMLQQDTQHFEQWAAQHGITTSKRVLDSRYRMRAFKSNGVLALYCDDFWFVLYQLPQVNRFSRLVVVPVSTPGQDFDEKTPAGKNGRCGEAL
jgi:hypothetical protein